MIRTNELTKVFRTEEVETTALNKINLEVKEVNYADLPFFGDNRER